MSQVSSLTIRLWSKLLHEACPDLESGLSSETDADSADGLGSRLSPVCEVQGLGSIAAFEIQGCYMLILMCLRRR